VSNELYEQEAWVNPDGKPTQEFSEAILMLLKENNEMVTNKKLALIRPTDTNANSVYTSPTSQNGGRGTVITQFIATDPAGAATFDIYIGLTAEASTLLVNNDVATPQGACPSCLINAMISPGESLWVSASALDTIVFSISGIERR